MFENYYAALALLLSEGGVPSDCWRIELEPEEIFSSLKTPEGRKRVSDALEKTVGPVPWEYFDRQVSVVQRTGANAVSLWDADYPGFLVHVAQPPPVLFYKGDLDRVHARGVAIVGTRKPSPPGVSFSRSLGRELSEMGIPVVSGLARGIDSAAHRGSLEGRGGGVAVIGTGLDVPYPPENAELMVDVARSGCVISEQLMGTTARSYVFPLRNRLISAMSYAVVVVEAGERSGALITAKWALEQGREVGAVPGFPGDFRSRGVNQLLKQGAFVVEKASDILHAVPLLEARLTRQGGACEDTTGLADETSGAGNAGGAGSDRPFVTDADASRLHAALGNTPTDVDSLSAHLGLDVTRVQRLLLILEMSGQVERDSLGRYTRLRLK